MLNQDTFTDDDEVFALAWRITDTYTADSAAGFNEDIHVEAILCMVKPSDGEYGPVYYAAAADFHGPHSVEWCDAETFDYRNPPDPRATEVLRRLIGRALRENRREFRRLTLTKEAGSVRVAWEEAGRDDDYTEDFKKSGLTEADFEPAEAHLRRVAGL